MALLFNSNDTINTWLNDLKFSTEAECMSILQGKSIIKINFNQKDESLKNEILYINQECINLEENIRDIQINIKNSQLFNLQYIIEKTIKLLTKLKNVIKNLKDSIEELKKIEVNCTRLKSLIESVRNLSDEGSTDLYDYLNAIKFSVSEIRYDTISSLIQELVNKKLIVNNIFELSTLKDIFDLLTNSSLFLIYLTKNDTIKKILDILKSTDNHEARLFCLKILIQLCNSKESLQQFDIESGFEHLSFLFCNNQLSDDLAFECVQLLSILLASSNYIDHEFNGYLENLQDIIAKLLDLTFKANEEENLLTCLSAILNLMNHDELCVDVMCDQNLVRRIADYSGERKFLNAEIKSKILSIFELISYNETCAQELTKRNVMQNILVENLYYIMSSNISQSLNSFILISTIKLLNILVRKSDGMRSQLIELNGAQILNGLVQTYPEMKNNVELIAILHIIEQEIYC